MKTIKLFNIIFILLIGMLLSAMTDPTEPPTYIIASSNANMERRLQGIFSRENNQVAVIDNELVGPNDYLPDGSRIIVIAKEYVKIDKVNGQQEILMLPSSVRRDGI